MTELRCFDNPDRRHHDPGRLAQPAGGSANYFSEVAQRGDIIAETLTDSGLSFEPAPPLAGLDELAAVHHPGLIETVKTAYERGQTEGAPPEAIIAEAFAVRPADTEAPPTEATVWSLLGWHFSDTSSPLFAGTWSAALGAASAAAAAARHVIAASSPVDRTSADSATASSATRAVTGRAAPSRATHAYALTRPPGHHAGYDRAGGFCYFNNAAVAANVLAATGRRVAILDVDYHHGNGTQEIFYRRADVAYVSVHGDPVTEYPYFWGRASETGAGDAEGTNHNLPIAPGAGPAAFAAAWATGIDRLKDFGADALVLSLGVDGLADDPVGSFGVGIDDYRRVTERFAALGLPTVIIQEGGYNLRLLGDAVAAAIEPFR